MISLTLSTWLTSTFHLPASKDQPTPSFNPQWSQLWNWLIDRYCHEPEPKIWQSRDWQGQVSWHAFDPVTQRSFWCESEAEMRCWLEERYYDRTAKTGY